ncbi:MAG: PilZ domain-containing protein [Deltaproteobacteria bacterium]|nr:PilZ domain-containing protein [Deltaproteobacteria bacterium]
MKKASKEKTRVVLDAKRREDRVTVNREFQSVDHFIAEYVMNLSRSGVFIRSKSPLPVGTVVRLEFHVVLDDIEKITGEGRVVRAVYPGADRPSGMGVIFTKLDKVSAKLVERILARPARC